MSRTLFRRPRSRKTGKSYICPQLRDGATDGELVEVHHRPAQKQEQWKPGLGENQTYRRDEDRSDVGRMENGANHLDPPLPTNAFLLYRELFEYYPALYH